MINAMGCDGAAESWYLIAKEPPPVNFCTVSHFLIYQLGVWDTGNILLQLSKASNMFLSGLDSMFWLDFRYGRKSADCTKPGNDVRFCVSLAARFGNLEFWKVKK